jgi:hypothetical protein
MKGTKKIERTVEDCVQQIYKMLREKEVALQRVRREIEALRVACPLLCDESDFAPDVVEPRIQPEAKTAAVSVAYEADASLTETNSRPVDAGQKDLQRENEKNGVLQLGQAALDASRTFLKRVLDNHFVEREPQRKTIRNIFEWLGRSNAA